MEDTTTCAVCARINPELSNVQNAELIGTSEASVRRHKRARHAEPTTLDEMDPFFKDIPVSHITSRGKSIRTPEGSWEKVTFAPNKHALVEALTYDDLADVFNNPLYEVVKPGSSRGGTETFVMTDLQIGKASERGGGTKETLAAIRESIATFKHRCHKSLPENIVIVDDGDPIENIFNVPTQGFTNDLEVPAQIRGARRIFAEAIKALAPCAPNVYFVSVPSNHGAFRTGFKTQGGTTDADFGLEINYDLEEQFADRPEYAHVKFVRPDCLDETAVLEVSGVKLAFAHGHQSGGLFKHGDWWAKQDHGRRTGWDADIFVFGHFHTPATYQSGDSRWVVGAASPDPGSKWFTDKSGESSTRGLTAFYISPGDKQPHNVRVI